VKLPLWTMTIQEFSYFVEMHRWAALYMHMYFVFYILIVRLISFSLGTGLYVQGCIYSVNMNSHTGVLSRSHRYRSNSKHKSPVTTVQYRSFSLLARGPVLLTCTQDGNLSFFRFKKKFSITPSAFTSLFLNSFFFGALILVYCSVALEINGYLTLRCSLKLAPRIHKIQASFCPLLSLEKGEFIGMLISFLFLLRFRPLQALKGLWNNNLLFSK